jgi:phage tail sheath protein FI
MSVAVSFPGIYIQELPLSTHTISPAPTSITAFVGYSNPWATASFNTAVQIFSFTDYETNFGGLFTSGLISSDLPRAVNAFFLNGGNNAYVVGLQPTAQAPAGVKFGSQSGQLGFQANVIPNIANPQGIQIVALQPADVVPMTATVTNVKLGPSGPNTVFDLVIKYGTQVETYRGLDLTIAQGQKNSLDSLINRGSQLISVQPISGGTYTLGTAGFSPVPSAAFSLSLTKIGTWPPTGLPPGFTGSFAALDFLNVFQVNSSLDNVEIFNLLLVPGISDNSVLSAALSFAERKRAFAIVDPPAQATAFKIPGSALPTIDSYMQAGTIPLSQNGALYFPYLATTDPISNLPAPVPPSGYVAGVCAATDLSRGVWKAPAGLATSLLGTTGPVATGKMNDPQQGVLNLDSINCLRTFAGSGTVVYGARTLVAADEAFAQSKYVPVRRMTLFIEQSLVAGLKWVVFEPNDQPLWLAIKSSIESFLLALFNQQALQGSTPSQAFQVKCDSSTTTPDDQQNGIVNIVVGVALLKPAEFVIIKISQLAGQTAGS